MSTFYRDTVESILTSCITLWYESCTVTCRKKLQLTMTAAERIVFFLPPTRTSTSPASPEKPSESLVIPLIYSTSFFILLPSARRLKSLRATTNTLRESFVHQAVRMLSSFPALSFSTIPPRHTKLLTSTIALH